MQEMDVAVKMLQPQATAEDSVRFLQEVAISGQFRHPNVVQLFGVVSVRNPVRGKTESMRGQREYMYYIYTICI